MKENTYKFAVGEEAKVIGNESSHNFVIGETVRIKEIDEFEDGIASYKAENLKTGTEYDWWWIYDHELEKL
jgi:hypothetical protein